MNCERCREVVSARLDDEVDDPAEREGADRHLASCAECRRFLDDAARITRLARTGLVGTGALGTSPDLVERVLAAAPSPTRRRRVTALARVLVGAVAVGQLALAVASLVVTHGWTAPGGHPVTMGGATLTHMSHEAAAWNVAIGVGFLWVALRSARTAGLVPLLSAFVAILTLLSAVDLAEGRVDPARLVSHLLIVVGLGLVLLLDRLRVGGGGSTPAQRYRRGGSLPGFGAAEEPGPPADGYPDLRPTAKHRAA